MGIPVSASFGELLRRHRLTAGLSQESLAEKAGLSTDAIRALERGRRSSPRPETLALLFDALELGAADRAELVAAVGHANGSYTPAPRVTVESRSRLRLPLNALIGRETLLEQITDLIRDDRIQLLTLIGPGGVGKTSLALTVANKVQHEFPDGVVFVDFAPVSDADLAVAVMLQALGIGETGEHQAWALLTAHLQGRSLLLVLDNLEHLPGVASLTAELVQSCPSLKILATSRTPLRLRAEQRLAVPPLALPTRMLAISEIANSPAVQLFLSRARAARLDFELTDENAADVGRICIRLDGLPLAIELAAARVTIMSPASLLERLTRSLEVLRDGPRDLPDRHQTLRSTIDWSHQLLGEVEQRLFRRLAVFAGGFDAAAAQTICDRVDGDDTDFLTGLTGLMENSLIRTVNEATDQDIRFGMLETVREYAVERLVESGERNSIRQLHADFYGQLAQEAGPLLVGSRQEEWLARLDREHDNLRAALDWARQRQDVAAGLGIAASLWRFWWTRGYLSEGRSWFDAFLPGSPDVSPDLRATALSGAGVLAWAQGDNDEAIQLHEWALAAWQEQGDRFGVAKALNNLGLVALDQGRLSDSIELYERSLALHREAGTPRSVAGALLNFGSVLLLERRWRQAAEILGETLTSYQELGDTWGMADTLRYLGAMALELGEIDRSESAIRESMMKFNSIGDLPGIAMCLEYLACIAMARQHARLAATYHGAATAMRRERGFPIQPSVRNPVDRMVDSAIESLGREEFEACACQAQSLPLDDVIELAAGTT